MREEGKEVMGRALTAGERVDREGLATLREVRGPGSGHQGSEPICEGHPAGHGERGTGNGEWGAGNGERVGVVVIKEAGGGWNDEVMYDPVLSRRWIWMKMEGQHVFFGMVLKREGTRRGKGNAKSRGQSHFLIFTVLI